MPDVELSNPDKVLFPEASGADAVTKADLFDYATRIADRMVPLIADRPAVLQRFPDGIDGEGWFQKHTPGYFPDWLRTVDVPKRNGGTVRHVVIDSAEALQYVVNQGTITVHLLGGTVDHVDTPSELLIDLDPSVDDPGQVVAATAAVRELLDDLSVTGFVKTTGSRGVHIHIPLRGDSRVRRRRRARPPPRPAARRPSPGSAHRRVLQVRPRRPPLRRHAPKRPGPARGGSLHPASAPRCTGGRAAAMGRGRLVVAPAVHAPAQPLPPPRQPARRPVGRPRGPSDRAEDDRDPAPGSRLRVSPNWSTSGQVSRTDGRARRSSPPPALAPRPAASDRHRRRGDAAPSRTGRCRRAGPA